MIATPMRRAAGIAAATGAVLFAVAASPAAADILPLPTQPVDATVRAECQPVSQVAPGTSIRATVVDVRITGQAPRSASPGGSFTFDQLTARFTIDPHLMRPQVEGTRGSLNARLDDLSLLAEGGEPNPAQVVSPRAPLDLGTKPVKIASAPWFDAPVGAPKATFDPVGPWTVRADAGGVAIGLNTFALTLTSYPEPSPTTRIAPTVTSLVCKPESPWFAKFPVEPSVSPLPTITSLSPNVAAGGEVVTITGTGIGAATEVTFGGNPAPFKVISRTQLSAVVPTLYWLVAPPPTLAWDVAVTTPAGTSPNTAADDFTYLTGTPAAPTIRLLTPTTVPLAGAKVRVLGSGLKGVTAVTVGRLPARFTVISDGSIIVAAPGQLRPGTYALRVTSAAGDAYAKLVYRQLLR